MEKRKFSVIIPIYNIEKYLRQCLDSLVDQTYSNFEAILVDDGSTDESGAICDEYAARDSRFEVVRKANGGLVSARIAGAKRATGDYCVCVDGDDWIDAQMLEKFSAIIDEYNPDMIMCSYYKYERDDSACACNYNFLGSYSKKDIENRIFPQLIEDPYGKSFPCMIWAKAFRREPYVERQTAVNPDISIGEDSACVIPFVYRAESIYVCSDPLYYYRYNPESLTKKRKPFDLFGPLLRFEVLNKQLDIDAFDFKEQMYRSTTHSLFNAAVSQFNGDENMKAVKRKVNDALDSVPYYSEAVKKCKYKKLQHKIMRYALLRRRFYLMKLYNTHKRTK